MISPNVTSTLVTSWKSYFPKSIPILFWLLIIILPSFLVVWDFLSASCICSTSIMIPTILLPLASIISPLFKKLELDWRCVLLCLAQSWCSTPTRTLILFGAVIPYNVSFPSKVTVLLLGAYVGL